MQQIQGQIDELDKRIKAESKTVTDLSRARAKPWRAQRLRKTNWARADAPGALCLNGPRHSLQHPQARGGHQPKLWLTQRTATAREKVGVAAGVGTNNISVVDKADVPLFPTSPDLDAQWSGGLLLG